jgi:hypothetical protein
MLYKVTIKNTQTVNSVRLEKGMFVEIAYNSTAPESTHQGKALIQNAFMAKYGVDLQKACAFNSGKLDIQRIN